ncbi:hypothetical protein N802_09165 [Knoellia sinensis KCTC 19936]|uniref:Uncharacterized protein n=1 Tax=Knoellia sinensis KCTC 19936 TaxID=1385520 RepID=A0A0A0JEI4_9MICO|nr:hypothetical protein [Knoellia sinensis]KGN33991.1 hypothetical protein N802_09165 [Knoellia sinensis KCTC 19936]
MTRTARTTALFAAFGLTAVALGGTAATPAQAASGSVGYTCSITSFHGENVGQSEGYAMSARFDSAIEDGVKVPVGTSVRLSQVPSQFVLSAPLVKAMRDRGVAEGMTDARMDSYFMQGLEKAPITYTEMAFDFRGGAATVLGPGKAAAYAVRTVGPHTLAAGKIHMDLSHRDGFALGTITCQLAEGQEPAIDAVFGVKAAGAATPAPTTAPSRPSVVQTDAGHLPDDSGMPVSPGVGALAFAAALVGATLGRGLLGR